MKLVDNTDPKTHFSELKEHFQLMMHQYYNLLKMGSTLSNSHYNTIIMSSLPESYCPSLKTIMAAKCTSAVLGMSSSILPGSLELNLIWTQNLKFASLVLKLNLPTSHSQRSQIPKPLNMENVYIGTHGDWYL